MKTYAEKLKDPRWQRKRLEILNRDEFKCLDCGSATKTLHVHHCSYTQGREPWDYDESNFRTLCDGCHETRHACEKMAKEDMAFIFARLTQSEITRLTIEVLNCLSIGAIPRAIDEALLTHEQIEGLETQNP